MSESRSIALSSPPSAATPAVTAATPAGAAEGGGFDALLVLLLQGGGVDEALSEAGNALPPAETARQPGASLPLMDETMAVATDEPEDTPVVLEPKGEANPRARSPVTVRDIPLAEDGASVAGEPLTAAGGFPEAGMERVVAAPLPPSRPEPTPEGATKTAAPTTHEPPPLADTDLAEEDGEMAGLDEGRAWPAGRHLAEAVEGAGGAPRGDVRRRETTFVLSQTPVDSRKETDEAMAGTGAAGDEAASNGADDKTAQSRAQALAHLAQRLQVLREQSVPVANGEAGDPALAEGVAEGEALAESPRTPARLNLPTPLQDPRWGRDFSERILWLTRGDHGGAEIRLNPRHLGPIQVRIQLEDDRAKVHIQAHHPATREAVEAALPRLRESLAEAGIQLQQAQVGGQGGGEARHGGDERWGPFSGPTVSVAADEGDGEAHSDDERRWGSDGLLSTFA